MRGILNSEIILRLRSEEVKKLVLVKNEAVSTATARERLGETLASLDEFTESPAL